MAELVTIEGQRYKKRDPLGVLGLSFITIGIYWLYWYYTINDEIRRYEKDDSVRPGIALLAVTLGWFIIVPPFISVYNTSKHIVRMEERAGVTQVLSPALNVVLLIVIGIAVGLYSQEHLNKVWDAAGEPPSPAAGARNDAAASRMTDGPGTTVDHVLANRVSWDADADAWVERGRADWARDEPAWGVWHVPESELGLLPDVRGKDTVELGCGTGYVSSWLARRGARPVGLDNSGRQLATARTVPGRVRDPVPADPRRRRAGAAPRRELRPRDLGVRSGPLVRPLSVDPRGGADPASGWRARVPQPLVPGDR